MLKFKDIYIIRRRKLCWVVFGFVRQTAPQPCCLFSFSYIYKKIFISSIFWVLYWTKWFRIFLLLNDKWIFGWIWIAYRSCDVNGGGSSHLSGWIMVVLIWLHSGYPQRIQLGWDKFLNQDVYFEWRHALKY